MQAWDDYLFGITFIINDARRTLSSGIVLRFMGEMSYDWGQVTAVSVLGTAPLFILIFVFQRQLVAGLTAGAVKG